MVSDGSGGTSKLGKKNHILAVYNEIHMAHRISPYSPNYTDF